MPPHLGDLCESSIEALASAADCYLVCVLRALCRHFRAGCHTVRCTYLSEYNKAKQRAKYLAENEGPKDLRYSDNYLSYREWKVWNTTFAKLYDKLGYKVPPRQLRLQEEYRRCVEQDGWVRPEMYHLIKQEGWWDRTL